jgi:hypothetical protein
MPRESFRDGGQLFEFTGLFQGGDKAIDNRIDEVTTFKTLRLINKFYSVGGVARK